MDLAKARRDKPADVAPKRINRGATKHLFGGRVEQHYVLIRIDCDNCVHCGTDYAGELCFSLAESRFAVFEFGYVNARENQVVSFLGRVEQRNQGKVNFNKSILSQTHSRFVADR